MDRIAFIVGGTFIYWNSIVLTLAAGVAICVFLACYLPRGNPDAAAVAVPMALVLGVILGRLAHWYFRPDSYDSFLSAMTDYTSGGYTDGRIFGLRGGSRADPAFAASSESAGNAGRHVPCRLRRHRGGAA